MGLFDGLAGMLGGGQGQGAQQILGDLLGQGRPGAASGALGSILGSFAGGGAAAAAPADGGAGPAPAGGLAGVLEQLAAGGLADHVGSWLSNNPNLPVSPQQIHDALGSEQVRSMAQASGLPVGDLLDRLAQHLPQAASEHAGTDAG